MSCGAFSNPARRRILPCRPPTAPVHGKTRRTSLSGTGAAFSISKPIRFQFPMNVVALEGAINEIVRRHEALRTTFAVVDGEPVQVIKPALHVPLSVIDLSHLPADEREQEARRLAGEEARQPIDISEGPLIHTTLLRLGSADHIFLVNIH